MSSLTADQKEALHQIATGKSPSGHFLQKTVPSLVKRGLVAYRKEEKWLALGGGGFGGFSGHRTTSVTVYLLTPAGFDAFEKFRTAWFEGSKNKLDAEYQKDLSLARGRILKEEGESA